MIYTPYQSEDPSPTIPTYRQKEEKGKNSMTIAGIEQLRPIKNIGPRLETRQSHTIKYGVSKIVPEGQREENKSYAALRGSAARRRIQ